MHLHTPQLSLENLPRATTGLTSILASRHTHHSVVLLIRRSTKPEIAALIRPFTCCHALPGFLVSTPHTGGLRTLHSRTDPYDDFIMTSTNATSTWSTSALATSSAMQLATCCLVSPRHLADYWPKPTRPEPPESDLWALIIDFDFVDFDFLHWPLTKSQNFRNDLSCSVIYVDSNFKLCFFIWSSKIG